jgi:hypothetical protein
LCILINILYCDICVLLWSLICNDNNTFVNWYLQHYDSQDPKMYFVKLEAYFRTKQLHEDAWLSAMQEFMTDDVLYVIEDIPEADKDTYLNLKRTLIDHYRLTPIAKMNLSAKLARRFQLLGESPEIFINDVIRQCKRLDCDTDTIIQHLKHGFNINIQRYIALKPPLEGDMASLIQVAREADIMTPTSPDAKDIAEQLKEMQAQITALTLKPWIHMVVHGDNSQAIGSSNVHPKKEQPSTHTDHNTENYARGGNSYIQPNRGQQPSYANTSSENHARGGNTNFQTYSDQQQYHADYSTARYRGDISGGKYKQKNTYSAKTMKYSQYCRA